ncbi:type II toxin-antitoxin system RelE/ParE family toxin, partial [Escherichia coli]
EAGMRIFKNAWFERFARKHRISDKSLRKIVEQADKGIISANLGSGVIKQRLARSGGGKSGGYRTIIFYRVAEKAFFIYAYAKNERENITALEENAFRKAAPHVLNLTDEQLAQLIQQGQFTEVPNE